ncbi:hypothetical protein FRC03_010636 [Tulasnella sp. 419]|nr:hypothetical protein FRC03_010636 [Tulasnella sp. 419]
MGLVLLAHYAAITLPLIMNQVNRNRICKTLHQVQSNDFIASTRNHLVAVPGVYHSKLISAMAVTSSGALLATVSSDSSICLFHAPTNRLLFRLIEGRDICSIEFSPNGIWIAAGSWDRTVRVWDIRTGVLTLTLEGHRDVVSCVAFSPDGKRIISSSWDETILVWNFSSVASPAIATLEGHDDAVSCVRYNPDGNRVVSGSLDQTVRLWDMVSSSCIRVIRAGAEILALDICRDGSHILAGSSDGNVHLWSILNSDIPQKAQTGAGSVGFLSSSGSFAVVGDWRSGEVRLWSTSGGIRCVGDITFSGNSYVTSSVLSNNGDCVVFGFNDGSIECCSFGTLLSRVVDQNPTLPIADVLLQQELTLPVFRVSMCLWKNLYGKVKNLQFHSQQFHLAISECRDFLWKLQDSLQDSGFYDKEPRTVADEMGLQVIGDVLRTELLMGELEDMLDVACSMSQFHRLQDVSWKIYHSLSWIHENTYLSKPTEWKRKYSEALTHDLDQLIERLVEDIIVLDHEYGGKRPEITTAIKFREEIITILASRYASFQLSNGNNKDYHRAQLIECATFFHQAFCSEHFVELRALPVEKYIEFLQRSAKQCKIRETKEVTEFITRETLYQIHQEWTEIGQLIGITAFTAGFRIFNLTMAVDSMYRFETHLGTSISTTSVDHATSVIPQIRNLSLFSRSTMDAIIGPAGPPSYYQPITITPPVHPSQNVGFTEGALSDGSTHGLRDRRFKSYVDQDKELVDYTSYRKNSDKNRNPQNPRPRFSETESADGKNAGGPSSRGWKSRLTISNNDASVSPPAGTIHREGDSKRGDPDRGAIRCSHVSTAESRRKGRDSTGNPLCTTCRVLYKFRGVVRPLSSQTNLSKKRDRPSLIKSRSDLETTTNDEWYDIS